MVALSAENFSKVKFHLGYNYGVPVEDLARVTRACAEIFDDWTRTKIEAQITRCEDAYGLLELSAGALRAEKETVVTGDVTRTVQEKEKDPFNRRMRYYLESGNYLARTLGVRNYRDPGQAEHGYLIDGGLFVNSIAGPQGLSAYEVAVSNGFVGTEQEWLTSLQYDSSGSTNAYTTAEKDKLAGIEDNATADQTANEILTAIKTVDGAGSGLDADTLDGQEGIFYQDRANHTGTQAIATVSGLQTALDSKMATLFYDPGGVGANVYDLSNSTGNLDGGTFT